MTRTPIPYQIHGPASLEDLATQLNMILAQLERRIRTIEESIDALADRVTALE